MSLQFYNYIKFGSAAEKVYILHSNSCMMLSESNLQYFKNKLEYLSLTDMACLVQ